MNYSEDEIKYFDNVMDVVENQSIHIDENIILDILQMKYRWPKGHVETINMCSMVSDDYFDHRGYLCFEQWKHLYDQGFTSHLNNIMDIHVDLRDMNRRLLDVRGSETMGNLYISKGTTEKRPSFFPHSHDYHVAVKTIYGKSKWMIGKEIVDVEPGTSLFIGAGTTHAVIESKEPRLSLSMNISG